MLQSHTHAPTPSPNTTPVKTQCQTPNLLISANSISLGSLSPDFTACRNKTPIAHSNLANSNITTNTNISSQANHNSHSPNLVGHANSFLNNQISSNGLKNLNLSFPNMVDLSPQNTSIPRRMTGSPVMTNQFHNLAQPQQPQQRQQPPHLTSANIVKPNFMSNNHQINNTLQQQQHQIINSMTQLSPFHQQIYMSYFQAMNTAANLPNNSAHADLNMSDAQRQQHASHSATLSQSQSGTPVKSTALPKNIIDSGGALANVIANN